MTARVLCNPLDLSYRFQDVRFTGTVGGVILGDPTRNVHREGADPTIVRFRGRYYMFVSMSRGFWHSTTLTDWTYQPTEKLPIYDYAPDARVVNDELILSASRKNENSPFYRSRDPLSDDFEQVNQGPFPFWDPSVFQDDDGRIYLYWGCSSSEPIRGVELDREFRPVGEPVDLIEADPERRGWERAGENHRVAEPTSERERVVASFVNRAPYVEGAWMTRHGDRYHLQYAAPGTQWNTYADGCFVSEHPLGPFRYEPSSPFSSKPGGFITGAGHGSTFQDEFGNWWHAATMRISVNGVFERRVGLFPAGFDDDGALTCNQNFGDYPLPVPTGAFDPWERVEPEWMLLSYRASARASSSAEGHPAALAVNEDIRTWWASAGPGEDEWLEIELAAPATVHAIQINLADHRLAEFAAPLTDGADQGHTWRGIYPEHAPAELLVEGSADGEEWVLLHDGRGTGEDRPHALVVLDAPLRLSHVRVRAGRLPFDGPFAVSGLRVFGRGTGMAPAQVEATGRLLEPMTAQLAWTAVPRATGYNVRYGQAPDRLHHSWLLYDQCEIEIGSLNAGRPFWACVDAFNENGVTLGETILISEGVLPDAGAPDSTDALSRRERT